MDHINCAPAGSAPLRLPLPPRLDRFPLAVRSSMLRRGHIVRCGPGVRGVGWPDCDRVRITSLAPWLLPGRIASHLSAAWIWGCALSPGEPLSVAVNAGNHPRNTHDPSVRLHQLRLASDEVTVVASQNVTTPLRTAYDLLHQPGTFGCAESLACTLLLSLRSADAAQLRERLLHERRPFSALAKQRAQGLLSRT